MVCMLIAIPPTPLTDGVEYMHGILPDVYTLASGMDTPASTNG